MTPAKHETIQNMLYGSSLPFGAGLYFVGGAMVITCFGLYVDNTYLQSKGNAFHYLGHLVYLLKNTPFLPAKKYMTKTRNRKCLTGGVRAADEIQWLPWKMFKNARGSVPH